MKIQELIEDQQVDEISLKGVGQAIGKGLNVAGQAVGGAVGGTIAGAQQFGRGVKAGYLGAKNTVGGTDNTAQPAAAAAPGSAPASGAQGASPAGGAAPAQQSAAPASGTAPADGAAPAASSNPPPGGATATPAASSSPPAGGATTEPAADANAAAPEMKAAEIVQSLDGVWKKATANQGSQTSSPAVQNQIRTMAKQAGLAGQQIQEHKKKIVVNFHSKFLDQTI